MPYTIKLRTDVFTKAARLAGFRSDYALAKAMDVNRSTVARVLGGDLQPGAAFIGGALTALAPMQFDDLFEIAPGQR
ncbi:transcriptional regulator [Actinosynnema sp. NPDC002837]